MAGGQIQQAVDRLVKALPLEGISEVGRANEYLAKTFLPALNRRFRREAASFADVHRGVPRNLDEVLSWEEERVVQRDWTVACGGRWHQVEREHELLSLAGKKVVVRTLRDGRVQLVHRERNCVGEPCRNGPGGAWWSRRRQSRARWSSRRRNIRGGS